MIKVANIRRIDYDLNKEVESIVTELRKDLLKLESELNKKTQINQYDKIIKTTK